MILSLRGIGLANCSPTAGRDAPQQGGMLLPEDEHRLSPPWETSREKTLGCPKPYLNCRKTYITFPKKKKKGSRVLPS